MLHMQKCAKYWTFHKLKQWSNIPQELLQQTWSGTKTSETADCCIQRQEESLKSVFWFHHNQHRDGLSLIKIPLPAPAPDPLNNSWRNWSPEALSGGGHRSSFRWPPIHPEEPENVTNCLVHVGRESDLWFYLRPSGHSTAYVHSASPAKADLSERSFERCIVSSILPSRWMRSSSWRDPSTHVAIIKLTSQDPAL